MAFSFKTALNKSLLNRINYNTCMSTCLPVQPINPCMLCDRHSVPGPFSFCYRRIVSKRGVQCLYINPQQSYGHVQRAITTCAVPATKNHLKTTLQKWPKNMWKLIPHLSKSTIFSCLKRLCKSEIVIVQIFVFL